MLIYISYLNLYANTFYLNSHKYTHASYLTLCIHRKETEQEIVNVYNTCEMLFCLFLI